MSNKIRLKRSSVAAKVPLLADLTDGELALNSTDGRIYYRHSSGTNVAEIKAGEVTNGVYTVGNQTISGLKIFDNNIKFANEEEGIILKSPNGTQYKVTVNDDGSLQTTLQPDDGFVFSFTPEDDQIVDHNNNEVQVSEIYANS